ncbi:MAG: BREX-1 system phosphatase PglZ type A [Myxococcota bacterium]
MKAEQVEKALRQKFLTENERLVFWHDPNGEFVDFIDAGLVEDLADVRILDLRVARGLSTKLRLEREDPVGKYLVYSQGETPPAEEDWLLDIRLYSAQFFADVASLWLEELELRTLSLREHLKARSVFLGNQDRRRKLARFVSETDNAAALDLKMMAVLVDSPVASPFDVLRALCLGHVRDGSFDLDEQPQVITTLEKMTLSEPFWNLMNREFDYAADEPSIAGLLRKLFISELFHQTNDANMDSLAHHLLSPAGRQNAIVFLTQWRDSSGAAGSYDAAAAAIAQEQKVVEPLSRLDLETLKDVYTFWEAEKRVVSSLKERLLADSQLVDVESISALASMRKAGHWLSGPGSDTPDRRAISDAYDAIVAAAELFSLRNTHRGAMSFQTPEELLAAYMKELHRFDRRYRRFCTQSKPAARLGWDLLKGLSDEVERVYDEGFLQPRRPKPPPGRRRPAAMWLLPKPCKRRFCDISPRQSERKRAFVIISDAFRYEAATELVDSLNARYRIGSPSCLPCWASCRPTPLLGWQASCPRIRSATTRRQSWSMERPSPAPIPTASTSPA